MLMIKRGLVLHGDAGTGDPDDDHDHAPGECVELDTDSEWALDCSAACERTWLKALSALEPDVLRKQVAAAGNDPASAPAPPFVRYVSEAEDADEEDDDEPQVPQIIINVPKGKSARRSGSRTGPALTSSSRLPRRAPRRLGGKKTGPSSSSPSLVSREPL